MLKIALTGGAATGKSYVLEQFRRAGIPCLVADDLAHGVTAAGTEATAAIAERFGAGVAVDAVEAMRRAAPSRARKTEITQLGDRGLAEDPRFRWKPLRTRYLKDIGRVALYVLSPADDGHQARPRRWLLRETVREQIERAHQRGREMLKQPQQE